jgi:hypothetical protein
MRTAAVLCLLGLAGCRFASSVPAEAVITCASDADCPEGRTCRTELGRCVFERGDFEAPQFLGDPIVSPLHARAGAQVTLTFQATEPLVRPPTARMVTTNAQRPLIRDDANCDPATQRWAFSVEVQLDDGEGPASLLVDMEDLAGNAVTGLLSGGVSLDFTPPTVPAGQLTVQPSIVRSGTPVTVLALASEALATRPALVARAGVVQVEVSPVLSSGASLTFTLPTAAFAGSSTALLEIVRLEDLAGNVTPLIPVGTLDIDDQPPTLSQVTVHTPWVSRVPGRDELRFSFFAANADRVSTSVGTEDAVCALDAGFHDCSYRPTAGQVEGASGVVVRAEDAAGNLAESRGAVTFDFTPPAVVPNAAGLQLLPAPGNPLFRPTFAGPDTTLQLSFSLTEPTLAPTVDAGVLSWTLKQNQGSSWLFEVTVPQSGAVEGSFVPQVFAEDLAGNQAALALALSPPGLVVDVTPPPVPSNQGLLLQRFPYGAQETGGGPRSMLHADAGAFEPGAVVRVFAFGNPLAGELARIPVGVAGGFAPTVIGDLDVADPWLEQVDPAGNRSPATSVRDHEWVASFSRFMPQQPTLQTFSGRFARPAWPNAPQALLDLADDAGVRVDSQGRLIDLVRRGATTISSAPTARLVYDATSGHLLAFAVYTDPPGSNRQVARWDGDRWWIDDWTDPELDGDPVLGGAEPAELVDAFELGVWAFDRDSGNSYRWTGTSWKRATPSGSPPSLDPRYAFDPVRRAIVAFAPIVGGGVTVQRFDGAAWTTVSPTDPEGDGAPTLAPKLVATSTGDDRVYLFVDDPVGVDQLWAWTGVSFARLGIANPPITASWLAVDPVANSPLLIASNAQVARWNGSAWQLVNVGDPEGDGSPSSPSPGPGVDLAARSVVVLAAGRTWGWTGASWRLLHAEYTGANVLNAGGGRFSPLAYANPAVGKIDVCGGGGWGGPIYADCARWSGFGWSSVDGGIGFWPNEYSGHVAPSGAGTAGLVISGSDAGPGIGATWVYSDGGWLQRDVGGVNISSFASWFPPANSWYHLQSVGTQTVGRLWNGGGWSAFESAPKDAGTMPDADSNWGPYSMAWYPPTGALVKIGGNSDTWVRTGSWQRTSGDLEGDGEPWGGCMVTDPVQRKLFMVSNELWEFRGASWARLVSAPTTAGEGVWPGIYGCFAVYDPWRNTFLASNWGAAWQEWDPGVLERPAIELRVPFSLGAFPATSVVIQARVRARMGGQGHSGATPVPGSEIAAWVDGAWRVLGQTAASTAAPAWVDVPAAEPDRFTRAGLSPGGTFRAVVRPAAANGASGGSVLLDYAELVLRVRRY